MALDGLVLSSIVYELQTSLTGGRIDKVFQPDRHTVVLLIRQPGSNFRLLINTDAQQARIQITAQQQENPATPPAFCMLLRKYLENGRIVALTQQTLDRIVHIVIENWDERGGITARTLIVEIMGKHSNIILTTENRLILDALHRIPGSVNRHREILPGRNYITPPAQTKLNPLTIDEHIILQTLAALNPQQKLSNGLVQSFMGLGPGSAQELLSRAGLDPAVLAGGIPQDQQKQLAQTIHLYMDDLANHRYKPTVIMPLTEQGVLDFACCDLFQYAQTRRLHFSSMAAAMDLFYRSELLKATPGKEALLKRIRTEKSRAERKLPVQQDELSAAGRSDELKVFGDLLTTNLGLLQKGQSEITLLNYHDPEQKTVLIPLDPKLTPVENAQHYYNRYTKAKRSIAILEQQIAETRMEIDYLDAILLQLEDAASITELQEIRLELSEQGYLPPLARPGKKKKAAAAAPVHKPLRFISPDDWEIFVGKNNAQNDYLTFKLSRPTDLWLHTKNIPGSHVIIRARESVIPPATLDTAAKLAAYFSKARSSSNVPVDYTLRKHVRKPSGAKPGFVIYEQQRTLYVTPGEETSNFVNNPDNRRDEQ